MKKVVIFSATEDTQEIRSLLDTLGVKVVKEYVQKRTRPHKASFLGPGKLDEIEKELKEFEYDLIIVNGSLKPSQHHYIEMKFQKECVDRAGVILRIFSDHAHTPEAIAQVTLAKLRYELPFLREWIHKAKSGDRPGFLSGGAYATDVYFEHAKSHARQIEERLNELSKQREVTRTKRRDSGYTLVSLAGYTNAGKSALMNKLCGASVEVDNRLFSTLSTTTRKVLGVSGNVLMTDTVGFIKDLPPDLVDAFNSTLEEIFYADLILLIFDSSEDVDVVKSKLMISMDILQPRIEGRSLLVVGNKIDLISKDVLERLMIAVAPILSRHELIFVSAVTGEGLDLLRDRIGRVQGRSWQIVAELPLIDKSYNILSRIRSIADVDSEVTDDKMRVIIGCKPEDGQKISGWIESIPAKVISSQEEPAQGEGSEIGSAAEEKGAPLLKGIR
jgi:GTP-binding protein HflX